MKRLFTIFLLLFSCFVQAKTQDDSANIPEFCVPTSHECDLPPGECENKKASCYLVSQQLLCCTKNPTMVVEGKKIKIPKYDFKKKKDKN